MNVSGSWLLDSYYLWYMDKNLNIHSFMNFRTLCWLKRYWWKIRSIEKWKRRRHPIHTILQPPVHRDLRALQPTELSNAHKRFIHHLDSEAIQAAVAELLKNRPDTLPSASKLFNNQQIIQQYWKTIDDRFLPSINCFNFLYYVVFPIVFKESHFLHWYEE